MIEVELPDGRIVEIDTNDPKVASTAAQRFILSPKAQAPSDPIKAQAPSDPIKDRAKKEYDEAKAKGIPVEPSATRRLLQGATFNFADEILAGLMTPLEMVKRGTFNPLAGYQSAKAAEDVALEDARENGGFGGTLAEIGGGILSGAGLARGGLTAARALAPGAGVLSRSGASLADGAVYGALAGFGDGGSIGERLGGALQGGAVGGAVGGLAPGAIALGSKLVAPVTGYYRALTNPTGYATNQVARAAVESGRTPQQLAAAVGNAANEGQPMFTLADAMGNPGQRMLATTARSPGRARTDVVEFLDHRQAGQGRRVAGSLVQGFDSPQTADQTRTAMTAARDATSDTAYTAARNNAGPVDVSRVIANIDDTLQPGVNQLVTPQTGIANDSIESVLDGFRRRLTDGRSNLTDFTAVQRVRGDLSDAVQSAVRAGQGNRARLLGAALRQLDAAMEQASSGFRAANRQHAQASRNIEAIDDGLTAQRFRPEDNIAAFQALPAQGQAAYRTGYVEPLINKTQRAAFGANKARPLINDAFADEAAVMAPGNPLMQRRIGREDTMFQTRNAAVGNSKTPENLNDDAAMGVDVGGMISNVLSGNTGSALRSTMSAISNGWNGNTAGVREEVARILLSRGQNVNPQMIQRLLDETVRRIEKMAAIAQNLGRGASAGLAVAPGASGARR